MNDKDTQTYDIAYNADVLVKGEWLSTADPDFYKKRTKIYNKIKYDKAINNYTICECGRKVNMFTKKQHLLSNVHVDFVKSKNFL